MIIVRVETYDEAGVLKETVVDTYGDNLGFEVARMFYDLGLRFARQVDPGYP